MMKGVYLCVLVACAYPKLVFSLDFLLNNGELTFISGLETKDLQLYIKFDVKEATIDSLGTTYTNFVEKVSRIPGFTPTSSQGKRAKAILSVITPVLLHITRLGKTIHKYLNPLVTTKEVSSCEYAHVLITDTELINLEIYLKEEMSKIPYSLTVTDMVTDRSKEQVVFDVLQTIELELQFAVSKLATILHLIDTLLSNQYPSSLNGVYHDEECIGILTNEEHKVKSCKSFANGIKCHIEIIHPTERRTMPVLISIPYMEHYLSGPNGEQIFVQDKTSGFHQALHCYQPSNFEKGYKTCQLTRLDPTCELALTHNDHTQIINECLWEKSTLMPPSVRLFDNSILITDPNVRVYHGTGAEIELVNANPPFRIESNRTISVEGAGVTMQYPGNPQLRYTKVTNSTLQPVTMRMLQNKLSYLSYWRILWLPSPIDYTLFSVNGILMVAMILIAKRQGRVSQRISQIKKMRFIPRGTLLRRPRQISGPSP